MTEEAEPVGSLAQETAKLLRAIAAERLRFGGEEGEAVAEPLSGSEHVCSTGWCPICQVVGYVHDHPDMVENVASTVTEAAVQVGRVLRDFLDKTLPPEQ